MINKDGIFTEMIDISKYFERNAESNDGFEPEFIASQTINNWIETLEEIKEDDAKRMIECIDKVEKGLHYNGTGWLDYKMHLLHLLRQNSIPVICIAANCMWREKEVH